MYWRSTGIILIVVLTGCFVMENPYSGLPPGMWRAVLKLDAADIRLDPAAAANEVADTRFEEVTAGELPFNFEVIYDTDTSFYIEIINGAERIRVDDIVMGRDRKTAKDTIRIEIPVYDSYFSGIYEENLLEGVWVARNRGDYRIPFVARYGQAHRFTTLQKPPALDLSGQWRTLFEVDTEAPYPGIGEFEQEGNYLTGTFRTETGDYRFLEGTVQADKLYLSCFDGSHAFLFEGKIRPDSSLIGIFRSGKHYQTVWEAVRDPDYELSDPDSLTYLRPGYDRISFRFPDAQGDTVSLSDDRFRDKIKIVQIMGTWCPNCRDETEFLVDYFRQNPSDEVEVIALAFEKYREQDQAQRILQTYRREMEAPYPILLAGYYDKTEAAAALPMLNHVLSYPTLIIIDRQDQVRKIHTGFAGPATSKYQEFVEEFTHTLQSIQAEQ